MDSRTPRNRILLLLLLAYIFNFIDRNIIGILAVPIRAEFDLSDSALGALGAAFGIVYAVAAIPIAWAADRRGRVGIIAAAVALWSLFTAACGMAHSYGQLVAARMGVAVGEAGGIAPSYALIADHFPKSQRARALAIFSFGIPIGSALGIFFGGWLATALSWRTAFILAGLAGLPVALLIRLFVQDAAPAPAHARVKARDSATVLLRTPSLWLLSLGAAAGSIPGYGFIFWLPSFFNRSFDLPVDQVGLFYGSIVLAGGLAGVWLGGWIGDRTGPTRPAAYALIPAACFLIAIPLFAAGLFTENLLLAWPLFALAQMLSLAWLGPVVSAVQQIVAPNLRATASASFLLITNLIGTAGFYIIGRLSDAMKDNRGVESLQYSIFYTLGFYLLSTLFYLLAAACLSADARMNASEN